ncbi:sugar ABC transporter permease [Deinococcus seoulensis]|uniref:Sugar ABC transporter permease n=2 Tax=Deinococcus TaxID=1298 RepID=A0ABQ2RUX6_9DEIO|nr:MULTISPECIES: carbohydrate ABC transporter permease [Deinococcus]GGR59034.1 sugar ABC transporter permease [Deinococcus seoulensis]GGS25300.1 sugar ABC transporter permease [Deinococcus knuensis]
MTHSSPLRRAQRNLPVWLFLGTLSLLWLYPLVWIVAASFKDSQDVFTSGAQLMPERFMGLENYVRAWRVANFGQYFGNSVLYGALSVAIAVARSMLAGYVLARFRFPGRTLLIALVTLSVFVPVEAAMIPNFQLINWIDKNLFTLLNTPFVVPLVQGGTGSLWVLLFIGAFRTVPHELYEAAELDGANFWQKFRMSIPLVWPVTATVVIFQFVHSWEDVLTPVVYTIGNPALRSLQSGLVAFQGENASDWVGLAAAIVLAILPVIVLFLVMQRYFVNGLAGAVKQ